MRYHIAAHATRELAGDGEPQSGAVRDAVPAAAIVQIAANVRDGHWHLDIRDHGRGFDPATAEKLFDIHNRGSGEGVTHGAGLGLAIARQLARRMGGNVVAHSPGPGKGAVFTVTLELAPPSAQPAPAEGLRHG